MIDRGRVYHITLGPGAPRFLQALDARTGVVGWQTPLNSISGGGNVSGNPSNWTAVTRNGLVVAYDYLPPVQIGIGRGPHNAPPVRNGSIIGNPTVRVFAMQTGVPIDGHAVLNDFRVPTRNPVDTVQRVFFFHQPAPFDQLSQPYLSYAYPDDEGLYWGPELPSRTVLGPPLISGDEIAATTQQDCFFRWRPGLIAQYFRLTHVHPKNSNLAPENNPPNFLDQYPLVRLPNGYLVADMATYKFLALFNPDATDGRTVVWHLDLVSTAGIPSVEGRSVFMGVNGKTADAGIMAVDGATGAVRWVFPFGTPIVERTREDRKLGSRRINFAYQPGTPRVVTAGNARRNNQRRRPGPQDGRNAQDGLVGQNAGIDVPITWWHVESVNPGAHRASRGLVVANGRVFGMVGSALVALDQRNGKALWTATLPTPGAVVSFAGTRTHLLMSQRATALTPARLSAYRMDNGKLDWEQETPVAGSISIASGVLFIGAEGQVHAFAPAERTFTMGIDSETPADYRPIRYTESEDEALTEEERARRSLDPTKPLEEEKETPEEEAARKNALGEACVLRFTWGQPLRGMLQEIARRKRMLPGVPLVISLDWLDSRREQPLTRSQGKWWTDAEIKEFAAACFHLTQAATPLYFDIAPELNVFLSRFPDLADEALAFVQDAGEAVKQANGQSSVIVSFNADLLLDTYGKTTYLPFGAVPRPRPWKLSRLEPILRQVDAIGITLRPQTGYVFAPDVPSTYLAPLREWFGPKPLLVTALEVKNDLDFKDGGEKQRDFLQAALRACYWMETKLIAVRLYGNGTEDSELALRTAKSERPALAVWKQTNAWRLVKFLTSELALAKGEPNPDDRLPN